MKQRFSVLLSLYKNEKPEYLRQSLDSILNQTVLPDEILIVKDGLLTNDLEEVLNEYSAKSDLFRFLSFKQNRGLGLALRDGVVACKNELIARMDTDDICKPERFAKQLAFLEDHPDIALLGTAIEEFSEDEHKPDSILYMPTNYEEIVEFAKFRNPFKHPTVFLKKTAVLKSGNYRHFLWFEDYDLFTRMIKQGYRVANLLDILVSVRANRDQFSRRGGLKYFLQDIRFQKFMYEENFISIYRFLTNIFLRGCVRFAPNKLRKYLYIHFLRKEL